MSDFSLLTSGQHFKKARTANYAGSYPTRAPTVTMPSGEGVIPMTGQAGVAGKSSNALMLVLYGTGSDGNTGKMRVIGWRRVDSTGSNPAKFIWIPVTLCEVTGTMGAKVGVAGGDIVATERFCDTLTAGTGNDGVSEEIVSPADDTIAHLVVDTKGCPLVEVIFDINSSATDLNALWAKY